MNKFLILTGMLLFSAPESALPWQVLKGRGELRVDFDAVRFFGNDDRVFVELYYGIHEDGLTYALDSGRFSGAAIVEYIVRSDSGIVERKKWKVPHTLADSNRFHTSQVMTGLESVALLPGGYTISLTAYDGLDISRRDSAVLALPIELFPKDREAFSDVELCTSIQPSSNQNSIFYKNTFEVIPNPGRLFGIGLPVMYYYVEVYNLAGAASQSAMTVRASVFDAAGTQVLSRDKSKPRLHDASVEVGTMNLSALKGGTYVFRMSLVDSLQGVVTSTERKFFIYKPGMMLDSTVLATSDFLPGEYAFMTEAEIDREAAYTKYVLSDFERSQFDALTELKAKKQFLFDFWKRGPAGAAPGGSVTKKEYLRRIEMANQNFSSGMSDGWKTDRGRVYVVYGPYDEIERSPSSAESNPYEIWHYNSLQGGVIFVFVDRNGMGDYTLVHSTHRNEMHEDDWYQTYALKIR